MEHIDLQYSADLKSKFLAYHILNFFKSNVLSSRRLPNLISYTQQEVSMFGIIYRNE